VNLPTLTDGAAGYRHSILFLACIIVDKNSTTDCLKQKKEPKVE